MVRIPELRRALSGLSAGEVLIPALQASLHDPHFAALDIHIGAFESREPDGYFHPSTHSTWMTRQLALYRLAPHLMTSEVMPYTGSLAITQGHFWHAFIQHILKEHGELIKDEVPFRDETFKRTGHMDGLLDVRGERQGLEIKTINSRGIKNMESAEAIKELKYPYWCQAQEYLDVFGLEKMRFLFITPDFPFPMREVVVLADEVHQANRREIYAKAIELSDSGSLPISRFDAPCCGKPNNCPTSVGCHHGE